MKEVEPLKILPILRYPNKILSQKCEHVDEVNEDIQALIRNMFTTMYADNGIGLAANQVGVLKRIFIMDTSNSGQRRYVFVNPEIISSSDIDRYKEGCLSFPGVFAFVKRPTKITVRALDENGVSFEKDLQGIEAVCFQHELDHLSGITFYDHLSPLQKKMINKKMSKMSKIKK